MSLVLYKGASYFDECIITDYYDGPLSGFLYKSNGDLSYYFQIVQWSENLDRRLYVLFPLIEDSFKAILNGIISKGQKYRPPYLYIDYKGQDIVDADIEAMLDRVIKQSGGPESLVYTEDLLHYIVVLEVAAKFANVLNEIKKYSLYDYPKNLQRNLDDIVEAMVGLDLN